MSQSQREKARNWVKGNMANSVAVVCTTALVPGAAAAVLVAQEIAMAYHIGCIYKSDFSMQDAEALAAHIGLAPVAGKIAALEFAILPATTASVVKAAMVAGIVITLGEAIINYCDEKWC